MYFFHVPSTSVEKEQNIWMLGEGDLSLPLYLNADTHTYLNQQLIAMAYK